MSEGGGPVQDGSGNARPGHPQAGGGLGARLGLALGRAVGTTLRSLKNGPATVTEVDRRTQQTETRDDEGRKVILRRTTIDEVEIEK